MERVRKIGVTILVVVFVVIVIGTGICLFVLEHKINALQTQVDDYSKEYTYTSTEYNELLEEIYILKQTHSDALNKQQSEFEQQEDELLQTILELYPYKVESEYMNDIIDKGLVMFDGYYEFLLYEAGIDDFTMILDDLKTKPELISYDPVLGGTMHFTRTELMNDRWVFAEFEDGHIFGYGIYEFVVLDDSIEWTVITEFMF